MNKKIKFKDLTDEMIEELKSLYVNRLENNLTVEKLAIKLGEKFNLSERTIRKWFKQLNFTEKIEIVSEQYSIAKERKTNNKKYYLISWAQNNTSVHKGFMSNIEAYAKFLDADIHIIAGRYQNPTSIWTNQQEDNEFWVSDVLPYLDANRHDIHQYMSIMSDIKIPPTASNPLTSMSGISGKNSCIFGHPRVHMEMIPVLRGYKPKMMLTTGAVTVKNYTDSKSGHIGKFHHTLGAIILEVKDDETFYVRQITANEKTGNFNDLYHKISNGVVTKNTNIGGMILGDLHFGETDEEVYESNLKLLDILEPENIICHDVFDGSSISHHSINDPFIQYANEVSGKNDLKLEIETMMDGLKKLDKFKNVVIVSSNHDIFLDRWLKTGPEWRKQPTFKNSLLYMDLSTRLLKQYESGNVIGLIPELINERYPKFKTLKPDESFRVHSFECGAHGNYGINGSRGSLQQFRKLNTKIIVGHYHTCGRKDNALAVGTLTHTDLSYCSGPSSWLQSSVIIHNDGKAQHINFIRDINNKVGYTTFKF